MIAELRNLDTDQQRQLLRLLGSAVGPDDLADDEVFPELIAVLRRALEVPPKGDLPQYLRRRLVEVAIDDFELTSREQSDALTDLELARLIVDFGLDAAAVITEHEAPRSDLATFLRTKSRTQRLELLTASQRFAALMTDASFDRAAARRRGEELQRKSSPQHDGAHTKTAEEVASDLSTAKRRAAAAAGGVGAGAAGLAAAGNAAAGAAGTSAALGGLGAAAGAAALAPAVAVPLAAVAGALYMAGRRKRTLMKPSDEQDAAVRARLARRSKLVQTVVILCAFLIAVTADEA